MKQLLFVFSLLMIGIASASMSINATLDVHNITADIYLDTSDMALDEQTIVYEGYEIEGLLLSELLKGFDFRFEMINGSVKFTYINISTPYTTMLVENILNGFDAGFDVEELNANPELVNSWLVVAKGEGNGYVEKNGSNYKAQFDRGFGDLPVSSIKIGKIDYSNEFIGKLLSFGADFSNVEFKDGDYEIPFTFGIDSEESFVANLKIINFDEVTKYVPENETILEVIPQITGLELGTTIIIEEKNLSDSMKLENSTQLRLLNITTNQNTSGEIYFNVNKSLVTNKDKVFLYVLEGTNWVKLNTTFLNETVLNYEYKAHTPHFSIFSIAEEETIIPPSDDGDSSGGSSGGSKKKKPSSMESESEVIIEPIEVTELEKPVDKNELPIEKLKENNYLIVVLILILILNITMLIFLIKLKKAKDKTNDKDKEDN